MRIELPLGARLVLVILGVALCAGDISASHFPDSLKTHLNRITACIYDDRFEQAANLIDSLKAQPGTEGLEPMFRAILYQSRMMAAESDFLEAQFLAALDSVESHAKKILAGNQDSAMGYYFLGQSYAFKSLYYGRAGKTWGALKKGLAAGKAFGKGYKTDPGFHDIAFGLGSYRYWKSVKTKAINWTPLFKNEKDNGIELLRLAADSSEISADAARTALIWIYINEGRFGEAIRLAHKMHRRYRQGLTFMWALGEAYFKLDDYRTATGIYERLLSQLKKDPGNYHNIIDVSYYLSICYRRQAETRQEYREKLLGLQYEVENHPIPETTRKRLKKEISAILKPAG